MLDRFFVALELLADLTVRSGSLMEYPRRWRRLIILTFPLAVIVLALIATITSALVYLTSLITSFFTEEFDDLWDTPSLRETFPARL